MHLHRKAVSVPFCEVRMCSVKTKEVKRSHKESQSGSCPLGGGKSIQRACDHDYYHGFICDGNSVHLFDHQSWLLAPNLTISFRAGLGQKIGPDIFWSRRPTTTTTSLSRSLSRSLSLYIYI